MWDGALWGCMFQLTVKRIFAKRMCGKYLFRVISISMRLGLATFQVVDFGVGGMK